MFILSLSVLLSSVVYVRLNKAEVNGAEGMDPLKVYGIEMLWNNSMGAYDVVVSEDGSCIAAVNNTGLYYFESNVSDMKWWYQSGIIFRSVALSADGEYVVVGENEGRLYYFNDSRTTSGERLSATWRSADLGGPVERGTVDMSDNGEYVVVGGTGEILYYFAGCRERRGIDEASTWQNNVIPSVYDYRTVHISSDGKYVAAGGNTSYFTGFVIFYKNANNATSPPSSPDWYAFNSINGSISIRDVAVSDDGYAIVAVDAAHTLHYWADATGLSGDPNATWTNPVDSSLDFRNVDMSADGSSVVAGSYPMGSLHFWANARDRQGVQTEDWVRLESIYVEDVAISNNGGVIAISAYNWPSVTPNEAYFFKSNGNLIRQFDLNNSGLASISGDGPIAAVAGPGWDSLYVFKVLQDLTPPLIENVFQLPANDSVYPNDNVIVYANITDENEVKQATLNFTYTNSSGTWTGNVTMQELEENFYNGTIPHLPYCTNVTYIIIAEDNLNNIITTEEMGYSYKYHVIPEFPSLLILPLSMMATLLAVRLCRKRQLKSSAR